MEIFITREGRQEGPLPLDEINARIRSGALPTESTLAWVEGCEDWRPLVEVLAIAKAYGKDVPPIPQSDSYLVIHEPAKPRLTAWEIPARVAVWLAVILFAIFTTYSAVNISQHGPPSIVAPILGIALFRRLLRLRCEAVAGRHENPVDAPLFRKGCAQALGLWFALFLATFIWGSTIAHLDYRDGTAVGSLFGACLGPFLIGVILSADIPFRIRRKLARNLPLARPYANVAWIVFLAFIAVLIAWTLSHPSDFRRSRTTDGGWTAFTSPGGDFTVYTPVKITQKSIPLKTPIGTLTQQLYSADRGNEGALLVQTMDLPRRVIEGADPKRLLDGARNGALEMSKAILLSESDIVRDNVQGREIHTRSADGKALMTMQVFVVGVRMYVVIAVSPKKDDPVSRRFLDSFRLN